MKIAPLPSNEQGRLLSLRNYNVMDTPAETDYNEIVKLASDICNVPISLITLLDENRQWFKAKIGINDNETTRDVSFCSHAILQNDMFIVENALDDVRFYDNPMVAADPNVRFYAGMPLTTPSGHNLGTLCVVDLVPRKLTEHQLYALKVLAKQVVNNLELRIQVNELKGAYNQLFQQKDDSLRINNIYERLLSIIGHDIKGPLNSFLSLIQMLQSKDIDERDFIGLMDEMGKSMKSTVKLMENLSKWGTSQIRKTSDLSYLSIKNAVSETFEQLSTSARMKGLRLIDETTEEDYIYADIEMLRFIIRNLISNAIKFTGQGHIKVSVTKDKDHTHLKISDTGMGMSQAVMDKLFNWNERSTRLGTSNEKGTGLGLLIIKEFVDKMQAEITIQSIVNQGTEMTISFSNTKPTLEIPEELKN